MRLPVIASVALVFATGAARAEEIPNPEFASWSKFRKGTSVTLKTTSTASGVTSEVVSTTTLVEVGPDKVVLETSAVTKVNGMSFDSPAQKRDVARTLAVPAGFAKQGAKGPDEQGTETLKVGGAEIRARWYRTRSEDNGAKTDSKVWTSDDLPGVMIKMEMVTTGPAPFAMKVEPVAFKKP